MPCFNKNKCSAKKIKLLQEAEELIHQVLGNQLETSIENYHKKLEENIMNHHQLQVIIIFIIAVIQRKIAMPQQVRYLIMILSRHSQIKN